MTIVGYSWQTGFVKLRAGQCTWTALLIVYSFSNP